MEKLHKIEIDIGPKQTISYSQICSINLEQKIQSENIVISKKSLNPIRRENKKKQQSKHYKKNRTSNLVVFVIYFFRKKEFNYKKTKAQKRQKLLAPFLKDLQPKEINSKEIGQYLLTMKAE